MISNLIHFNDYIYSNYSPVYYPVFFDNSFIINRHLSITDGHGNGYSLYSRIWDYPASGLVVGMGPIHVRGRDWRLKGARTVRQKMRSKSGRKNLFFHHRERSVHERLIRFVDL